MGLLMEHQRYVAHRHFGDLAEFRQGKINLYEVATATVVLQMKKNQDALLLNLS